MKAYVSYENNRSQYGVMPSYYLIISCGENIMCVTMAVCGVVILLFGVTENVWKKNGENNDGAS